MVPDRQTDTVALSAISLSDIPEYPPKTDRAVTVVPKHGASSGSLESRFSSIKASGRSPGTVLDVVHRGKPNAASRLRSTASSLGVGRLWMLGHMVVAENDLDGCLVR